MKLSSLSNFNVFSWPADKGNPTQNSSADGKRVQVQSAVSTVTHSDLGRTATYAECYNKCGNSYNLAGGAPLSQSNIDRGTASHTTVYINRAAFDEILYKTTYGDVRWEEMGVDDEKSWVVINGQRFECEHSPEEKAMRKRFKKSLIDLLNESQQEKNEKGQNNGKGKPKGNIEALKGNKLVMELLGKIFNEKDTDAILKHLA